MRYFHTAYCLWNSLPQDLMMTISLDGLKREWTISWRTGLSMATSLPPGYLLLSAAGGERGVHFSAVYGLPKGSWWANGGNGMLD